MLKKSSKNKVANKVSSKTSKAKEQKSVILVDFTNVSDSGFPRVPPNDYLVKIKEGEVREGKTSGEEYIAWTLEITEGKHSGKSIRHTSSLGEKSLWTLKNFLIAIGIEVPKSKLKIRFADIIGRELGVSTSYQEYQGKKQTTVTDVFPAEDLDDEEDEDEEDEDDENEDDDEDEDDEDSDEDEEDDEEDEDDEEEDEDDDDDEDEEDEEDEEPAPRKKYSSVNKKKPIPTKKIASKTSTKKPLTKNKKRERI